MSRLGRMSGGTWAIMIKVNFSSLLRIPGLSLTNSTVKRSSNKVQSTEVQSRKTFHA